jgi:diguanylate cyclase (GGDEF)-like protein
VLDIDFFKKINDAHGHTTGDEVLRQFAVVLKAGIRTGDLVGRMGGEEFCAVLPNTNEQQAMLLAERLRNQILSHRFCVNDLELKLTSSAGVAELRESHLSVHCLIDDADTALLIAKRTGRNRVLAASSLNEAVLDDANRGPLGNAQAQEIMVPAVAQVRQDAMIENVAQQLVELNLDSVPVVDGHGKLKGLITEQDLVNALLDSESPSKQVSSCPQSRVAVFDEATPADEIATFFARTSIQRVVIVREGEPVGLVSRRTLLRWLLNDALHKRPTTSGGDVQKAAHKFAETERTINELSASVSRLLAIWNAAHHEEISPGLIGEATRIQHFVETLLTTPRPARSGAGRSDFFAVGATTIG